MKLFWSIIRLSGAAIIFVAVLGFILGLFNHVITINGAALPLIDGVMAIALGIFGALFLALGFFMQKRAEKKDIVQSAPQLDMNDLGFIVKAIKRTRRRNFWIGLSLVVFAGLFIVIPFADPEADPSSGGSLFIFGLAGLMIALGSWMLYKAMQLMNVEDSAIYKTIVMEPRTITGLDATIIHNRYTKHASQINAQLSVSTKKIATLAVSLNELELLRQYLQKHNPQLQYNVKEQVA